MRGINVTCAALIAASILGAQTPSPTLTSAQQPDLQTLSAAVRGLRRTSTATDEIKAKVDKLITDAQTGEARRRLANAYALLKGQS